MSDYIENCPKCNNADYLLFHAGRWVIDVLNTYVPVEFCSNCGVKLKIPKQLVGEFKFDSDNQVGKKDAKETFRIALDECIEVFGVRGPEMCNWSVWMPLSPNQQG